jgi:hypothetical protein
VAADDVSRSYGSANPGFTASYSGFVLGQDAGDLDGTLEFATDATRGSATGTYTITPSGVSSPNYSISFSSGTLTVANASGGGSGGSGGGTGGSGGNTGGDTGGGSAATDGARLAAAQSARTFDRGVPPFTPGDASFRTTQFDAPPAISAPFELQYSLGEIVQLATDGVAAAQGFTPAAGGLSEGFVPASGGRSGAEGFRAAAGQAEATTGGVAPGDCAGSINRGNGSAASCGRQSLTENYWTTTGRGN